MGKHGALAKFAAFAAVCGAATAWLAVTIGNLSPFEDHYRLSATFDDVTGLLENDSVKVAGVPVGKVTGIEVVGGRARVTFTVREGVRLPEDSRAAVRWRNLLGQRYVYVHPGRASTVLRSGDEVTRTVPVVDIGELFGRLGPVVRALDPAKVNAFLDAVVGAIEGNEGRLRQAVADLATVAGALAERDEAIGRLVANLEAVAGAVASREAQIRAVLDNLVALATTFNEHAGVLEEAVVELGSFNRDLGGLLAANRDHLDRTVDNLDTLVRVVRDNLGVVDHLVGVSDVGLRHLFTASRYGEWLNQTIPCGRIGYPPERTIALNDCLTGSGTGGAVTAGGTPPPSGATLPPPVRGATALAALLGVPA